MHWSYAALSNEQARWQFAAIKVRDRDLPAVMAREGFAALWVDTYGYEDGGASILAELTAAPGAELRWSNDRYSVVDIRFLMPLATQVVDIDATPTPSTMSLATCPAALNVSIEYVGGEPGPFDTAVPLKAHRDVRVVGWIVPGDKSRAAAGVDAALDGKYVQVYYGFPRGDIAADFGSPAYRDSGFVTVVPGELLAPGPHRLSLRAASASGGCAGETPPLMLAVQ